MNNQYTKISEDTLGVVETKPQEVLPIKTYSISFLKQQLIDIQAQKDRDNALRDGELAEVNLLITQASKVGIITL